MNIRHVFVTVVVVVVVVVVLVVFASCPNHPNVSRVFICTRCEFGT